MTTGRERVADTFLASTRRLEALFLVVRGVFDGLWLGVLDDETLRVLAQRYYRGRGSTSEQIYLQAAHNERGLFDWERDAVAEFFPPTGRIVVTGAGAGREVLALLRAGQDATGFECDADLVTFGQRLLADGGYEPHRLLVVPPDAWPTDAGRCDAVVVGWGSYMLTPGSRRRIAFLRDTRAALAPGGPLLLSFWARKGASLHLRTLAATANVVRRVLRREPVEVGDLLKGHFVHSFTREELVAEVEAAGFDVVHYETQPYAHAVAIAASGGRHDDQGPRGSRGLARARRRDRPVAPGVFALPRAEQNRHGAVARDGGGDDAGRARGQARGRIRRGGGARRAGRRRLPRRVPPAGPAGVTGGGDAPAGPL